MSESGMDRLEFDNRFTRELPADPQEDNRPRQVSGAMFSRVRPAPVSRPRTLIWSAEMLQELGLTEEDARGADFAEVFSGNRLLPGMDPHATCYGGHQFGNWAGQLGDGRAINLGEVRGRSGRHWMLQLKGAGTTPYSRGADGRAVLRSSIREFICSEAMYHLGVRTTRALSLVLTGDSVMRDMFYDGRPEAEPGAIVCRVSPAFIRFGHFQLPAVRQDPGLLRQMLDYTIRHHFPAVLEEETEPVHRYVRFFEKVCDLTLEMVVHWMRVGFVHGVMNTDNMSVLGETIDYGPYGWIDVYNPDWTPNTTDAGEHRYRFGAQARIAYWNLHQLANAIVYVTRTPDALEAVLAEYPHRYERAHSAMMADKLGLEQVDAEADEAFLEDLDRLMRMRETDMTLFFRRLADFDPDRTDSRLQDVLADAFYDESDLRDDDLLEALSDWEKAYRERLLAMEPQQRSRRAQRMNAVNPLYVPRNYLVQEVIDSTSAGETEPLWEILDVLRRPYDEQPGKAHYAAKRPEWARHRPGCSMLSCSS